MIHPCCILIPAPFAFAITEDPQRIMATSILQIKDPKKRAFAYGRALAKDYSIMTSIQERIAQTGPFSFVARHPDDVARGFCSVTGGPCYHVSLEIREGCKAWGDPYASEVPPVKPPVKGGADGSGEDPQPAMMARADDPSEYIVVDMTTTFQIQVPAGAADTDEVCEQAAEAIYRAMQRAEENGWPYSQPSEGGVIASLQAHEGPRYDVVLVDRPGS